MNENILDGDFNIENPENDFDKETIKNINLTKIELNEAIHHVRQGRGAFIALIVLPLLALLILLANDPDFETMLGQIIQTGFLVVVYVSCLFGIRYNAKASLIIGFTIYALLIILDGLLDPRSLFEGILIKFFILFFMARGILAAFNIDKLLQKLSTLGVPSQELALVKQLKKLERTKHHSE